MSPTLQYPGTCLFCGEVLSKRSMLTHHAKCAKRLELIQVAEASERPVEILWQLRIQAVGLKEYWLMLEMKGSASLTQLDKYLREIWLECCGHLSQFTIGGWGGTQVGKARKADTVFETKLVLRHLYDYGTTSETDIQVLGSRRGRPLTKHPITLMARNLQPRLVCQECGQPAIYLCQECQYEDNQPGLLCEQHAQGHPHGYDGLMPLLNSPRTGLCGYTGPDEPPY